MEHDISHIKDIGDIMNILDVYKRQGLYSSKKGGNVHDDRKNDNIK